MLAPGPSDHFAVFTPYCGHWSRQRLREVRGAPRVVRGGRERLTAWLRSGVASYEDRHDDLAGDATSRLSPHLHFGTLSPRRAGAPGARRGRAGRRGVRTAGRLARLPPPGAGRPAGRRGGGLPHPARPVAYGAHGRRGRGGVAGGPYRRPGGGRGDAAAAARGLDAQPGAAVGGEFPHQDAVRRRTYGAGCPSRRTRRVRRCTNRGSCAARTGRRSTTRIRPSTSPTGWPASGGRAATTEHPGERRYSLGDPRLSPLHTQADLYT